MATLFSGSTLICTSPARSSSCILAAVVLLSSPEPAPPGHPVAVLFGVTAADLAAIDRGQILVRAIGTTDSREIATLGIARIKATPEFYAERLADIARFINPATARQKPIAAQLKKQGYEDMVRLAAVLERLRL